MSKPVENEDESGGLAQFCVEHREVSWLALIAVLVWGGIAYTKLGQQEDPTIPQRTAMLVTVFPARRPRKWRSWCPNRSSARSASSNPSRRSRPRPGPASPR